MTNNGVRISELMVGPPILTTLAGWCNVFHQSTENFIIGILIPPIIAKYAKELFPWLLNVKDFSKNINPK